MKGKINYIDKVLLIISFFAAFGLSSCEKVIELPLKETLPLLVIEGNIDDFASVQEVLISRSSPFEFVGKRIPVSGAVVLLRENDGNGMVLLEQEMGRYAIANFRGKPGETYHLTVQLDGEEYTAQSTMPRAVVPDSVGTVTSAAFSETIKSAAVIYTDPEEFRNYYRFKLNVNSVDQETFWVFNDRFSNGKVVTQTLANFSNKLQSNDEVIVKMQNIDSLMYHYWNELKGQGPGASTPANPVSNISNGALGYFSANSVSYTTFKVK